MTDKWIQCCIDCDTLLWATEPDKYVICKSCARKRKAKEKESC